MILRGILPVQMCVCQCLLHDRANVRATIATTKEMPQQRCNALRRTGGVLPMVQFVVWHGYAYVPADVAAFYTLLGGNT